MKYSLSTVKGRHILSNLQLNDVYTHSGFPGLAFPGDPKFHETDSLADDVRPINVEVLVELVPHLRRSSSRYIPRICVHRD